MKIARISRLGLALVAVLLAARSPLALGDGHLNPADVAAATNQSCENIQPGNWVCHNCATGQNVKIQSVRKPPTPVGFCDCKLEKQPLSPLAVLPSYSQGTVTLLDSGPDGVGQVPGGCSSCGGGGTIPDNSQMIRFELARIWRSTWTHDGNLGRGMYTNFDYYVTYSPSLIEIRDPNTGFIERFINSGGGWVPAPGVQYRSQLTVTATEVTFVQEGGLTVAFAITGYAPSGADYRCRLDYVADRNGNKINFAYALPATNATANVLEWSSATDAYGRATSFTYTTWSGMNVLSQVSLSDGRVIQYNYTSDNTQFAHTVQWLVGGTPSGIQATWYTSGGMSLNEPLLSSDHFYWSVTLSNAAYGRVRAFQRHDGNFAFARSATTTGGITTITDWNKNVVQQLTQSPSQLLLTSANQHTDGSWESDITYTPEGNYLPTEQYTEPADTGVGARITSVTRDPSSDMVLSRSFPDLSSEAYGYNSFNEMTSFTDRGGQLQTWVYDANGNMKQHNVAVGTLLATSESWTYNAQGQVTSHTDFNGNVTGYSYYPTGASQYELETITLPSDAHQPAGSITFTYDNFGRVASETDPVGRTVNFTYDVAGRLIQTKYPDMSTEVTNYGTGDNSAQVLSTVDRNGNTTNYSYDSTGRVDQTQVVDVVTSLVLTTTTSTYDPATGLLTSTNTDGDDTEYTYDYLNRICTTTVHPTATLALSTQNTYSRYWLLSSLDYYNRNTSYGYDVMDRLTSTTQELVPGGGTITTSSTYWPIGLVKQSYDANTNETDYAYDARNRLTTTTVAVGVPGVTALTTLTYDNNSNVTNREDERGNNWATAYTCRDRVFTSADPLGDTTTYNYTADTMVATVQNANGHTTTNAYYPCCARLWTVTDPYGNVKTFVYDYNGNTTQTTDESNRVVTYQYDGLNRQTQMVVDPGMGHLNLTTTTAYDPTPGVIGTTSTTTSPASQVVTTYLDGLGRTAKISGDTATVRYTYDHVIPTGPNAGLVQATVTTDPGAGELNLTSSTLTNGPGWTIQSLDGFGNATGYLHDNNGNTTQITDRDGRVTTNVYDQRNRTTSTTGDSSGIAATTSFVYGPTNNLLQVTDADGKVTRYTYDTANRRLKTTYAHGTIDARTWTVTYKPLGQVLTLTKPNGIVITYSYENRELLSSRVYTQGMTTLGTDTFSYHPNRLLATADGGLYTTTIDRSTLNTSYDMANRLIQENENWGPGAKTLAYQYTPDSLVSQTTYPGGTVAGRTYTANRLLNQTLINSAVQATFGYDTADRRTSRTYINGTQTTWALDANSRVTDLKHATTAVSPTTLQEWTYGYTNEGDPLSQADVTPSYTVHGQAYQYDGLHQVSAFQRGIVSGNTVASPVASQAWTLSKAGDWNSWATTVGMTTTTDTRTHNNIHALTARSAPPSTQTYDTDFNQTGDGINYTFVYDANDQLAQATNTGTMAVANYAYDALGRRVEKNVGGTVTWYYYAGAQIVEEHDGADAVTAFYTYGDYIDEPLTMDRGGSSYYYHANRLYSVYLLTTAAGAIAERVTYTPYGVATTFDSAYGAPETTSRVGNPYLFTGRELDSETLLCFFRARTYDPVQGRFKQLDPAGFAGGDFNLFRYCGNMPTNLIDPDGLVWQWIQGAWGVAVGAGAGVAQGGANILNAGTDMVIGVANTPALAWNYTAGWVAPNVPYIPAPDWSKGLVTNEGKLHAWSKGAANVGIIAGTAAVSIEAAAARKAAALAAERAAARVAAEEAAARAAEEAAAKAAEEAAAEAAAKAPCPAQGDVTPGGRQLTKHAIDRMTKPPAGRSPMTPQEVDQVLDTANKVKKISPHPEGNTITLQNTTMPGKPQVVVDAATGRKVITVIKGK